MAMVKYYSYKHHTMVAFVMTSIITFVGIYQLNLLNICQLDVLSLIWMQ